MALTSPGVEVTIIDQSQYLPAAGGGVPLVVFATAQNKSNPSGTGVAQGTTAANAGKLYQITSQKDLADFYGTPFFYSTTNGTPIQGYELNEYGLLAAYSALGITNRVYCLRADIDLSAYVGAVGRPTGAPADGLYWLDSTTSTWGIFEFSATNNSGRGAFTKVDPILISDETELQGGGAPLDSIGNIGDYAVVTISPLVNASYQQYFFKGFDNSWHGLGSSGWSNQWPTIQGSATNPTLNVGDVFRININGQTSFTVQVPPSPDNTVYGVANVINSIDASYITADVSSGKLVIFSSVPNPGNTYLSVSNVTGSPLTSLGITIKNYFAPLVSYGTSAQQPLWTSSATAPHPTGSVWIKIGSSGNGQEPVMSEYNATTGAWITKNVTLALNDWSATNRLDNTGGSLIPVGTLYGQYNFNNGYTNVASPTYYRVRTAIGPTIVTGNTTPTTFTPAFSLAAANIYVQVSVPSSSTLSSTYTVSINTGSTVSQFITAWTAANIPYTTIGTTTEGEIVITHTEGGEIMMNDFIRSAGAYQGFSSGLIAQAGFVAGDNCRYSSPISQSYVSLATTTNSVSGNSLTVNITINNGVYMLTGTGAGGNAGSSYVVGDSVFVNGALLGGVSGTNDLTLVVTQVSVSGGVTGLTYNDGFGSADFGVLLSNWGTLTNYRVNEGAPVALPPNNTPWYWSVADQVDIMVQSDGMWNGYKNVNYDSSGQPTPSGVNATDPNGPIISASEPTTQSDGTDLEYGDLWVDTSDLEMFPLISRWESVNSKDMWVLIDNSDQTSPNGILFSDARWATNGTTNVADDPIPTIKSLLTSDYLDLDAPNPDLYPEGMLLFNTRRSGYNVKEYKEDYFNSFNFPDQSLPLEKATWLSVSGLESNGAPYMGRKAQRQMVVKALRSVIDTNTEIRDEDNFFTLMATPAYPETQPNMVVLNADRGETCYILGDTPMRLPADATAIQAWATNAAGATSTGEDGCVTRNTYLGLFYPSGIAPDLSGNLVAVPPSHMMLRTFLRNDQIAYPWFAAAGTRRGNIDNATNIGYIDSMTGEFQTIKNRIGLRDVLYINFINPLTFFTGVGLLNYGNKTSYNSSSALDRTNVARLIAYVRRQLTLATRPFVFEPNDALTRNQVTGVVQTLMVDLVAKRGIYDYLVICDASNNTPARIDRNELWVDVAIEPVKAAEFIYIPVRVLNTGEIASL
jgi:Phage tail sheath C-terminal domain